MEDELEVVEEVMGEGTSRKSPPLEKFFQLRKGVTFADNVKDGGDGDDDDDDAEEEEIEEVDEYYDDEEVGNFL